MATNVVTRAGQTNTVPWPQSTKYKLTTKPGSDQRGEQISLNVLMNNVIAMVAILTGDAGCITTSTPTIGTTVTIATPASYIQIGGVIGSVAAETAKAFGSLGTIPTGTWGLIAIERIANATTSFVSAAANYTTGYATEALALAAMPARTANKACTGYITIYAGHASGWVAGTDALQGGTGGNPATTTNYYGVYGINDALFWTANQIAGNASVLTSANA